MVIDVMVEALLERIKSEFGSPETMIELAQEFGMDELEHAIDSWEYANKLYISELKTAIENYKNPPHVN